MSPRSREHIDARLADLRQAAANALHSAAHGGYRGRPSEVRNILTDLLAMLDESDEEREDARRAKAEQIADRIIERNAMSGCQPIAPFPELRPWLITAALAGMEAGR